MNLFTHAVVKRAIGLAAVASLIAAPLAFAKQEDGRGADQNEDRGKGIVRMVENDPRKVGSTLEVHINDNGKTLVRGAKVTAVSGGTITAATGWGAATITWTITVGGNTQFVPRGKGVFSVTDIALGDLISFNGMLMTTGPSLTVAADVLKDWSIQKTTPQPAPVPGVQDIFQGSLQSIVSTTTLPTTLTLHIGSVDYTVNVSASTQVLAANWSATTLAAFQTGDTVRVFGTLSSTTTVQGLVVRDASR
jgi:hypothetical protein